MTFFDFPIYSIPSEKETQVIDLTHQLIVLVNDDEYGPEEKELLEKVLKAVDATIEQIQLITTKQILHYQIATSSEQRPLIIAFGIRPEQLGLQLDKRLFQIMRLPRFALLFSQDLVTLSGDVNGKRALWQALKVYFHS